MRQIFVYYIEIKKLIKINRIQLLFIDINDGLIIINENYIYYIQLLIMIITYNIQFFCIYSVIKTILHQKLQHVQKYS